MRRIPELDSLRGLAAATILFHHAYPEATPMGWAAVDLFFVLSGYLITGIILRDGGRPGFLRRFYARRALRIWPIYYLALVGVLILNRLLSHPEPITAWPFFATYTQHVQGYVGAPEPRFPTMFAHSWSLAIEEQFYTLWPAVLLCLGRRSIAFIGPAMVGLSVYLRSRGYSSWLMLARFDGLALGALLAVANPSGQGAEGRSGPARRWALPLLVLAALVGLVAGRLAVGPGFDRWDRPEGSGAILGLCGAFTGLVGLVAASTGHHILAPLRWTWLRYLGSISYGLYLYHFPILQLRRGLAARFGVSYDSASAWWITPLALILSLIAAALSWHLIESPILRLKDRFDYRKPE